jgi:hypothetical protein
MKKQLLSLLVILSAPTFAAELVINKQALQACSFIENDFNRLLCYDNTIAGKSLTTPPTTITKKLTPPTSAMNVPAVAPPSVKPKVTAEEKVAKFGLEHKNVSEKNGEDLKASISNVEEAAYGELIITLDNKQQWRQIGSDQITLSKGDRIIINRGFFNSFILKKEGQNRSIRVKRTN